MHEQETGPTFLVPAEDYLQVIEQLDETSLGDAYIGRWASRAEFGLHMLDDTSARRHLSALPIWLREFVKLDGEAFATELESEGVYVITTVESGVIVFDGGVVRKKH